MESEKNETDVIEPAESTNGSNLAMDDQIVAPAMAAIRETFGYGRPGTHSKKCEICGEFFDEPNDLEFLVVNGPSKCPHCIKVIELKDVLIKHWNEYRDRQSRNPVEQRNYIKDSTDSYYEGVTITSSHLDDHDEKTILIGRTAFVKETIDLIESGRKQLYFQMDAQLKILESIYERKDRFWNDGGNLWGYIRDASLQLLVVKLREYLGNKSKFSITKIQNRILNRQADLFERHRVITRTTFRRTGDVMETEYPHFPIDEYLSKLDDVLAAYRKTIDAIADVRDNLIAHFGKLRDEDSVKEVTFRNIKRILNSLKIIYDGFLYSVAPDKFAHLRVEHNMFFDSLNKISEFWAKHKKR